MAFGESVQGPMVSGGSRGGSGPRGTGTTQRRGQERVGKLGAPRQVAPPTAGPSRPVRAGTPRGGGRQTISQAGGAFEGTAAREAARQAQRARGQNPARPAPSAGPAPRRPRAGAGGGGGTPLRRAVPTPTPRRVPEPTRVISAAPTQPRGRGSEQLGGARQLFQEETRRRERVRRGGGFQFVRTLLNR